MLFFVGISYNQPKLSPCAEWDSSGLTLTTASHSTFEPGSLFVDRNNTVFVTYPYNHTIYVWNNSSASSTRIISTGLRQPDGLFVSTTEDIYFSNYMNGLVYKWMATTNATEAVAYFCDTCFHMFIDINDVFYCSIRERHQVIIKSLYNNSNIITVVAGVGFSGSDAHMLNYPAGIFVNTNLDLYVADYFNHRIQLFRSGVSIGITVAGESDTFELVFPIDVVLDADNHIYIVDYSGERVVGSYAYGFRFLVGCTEFGSSILYRNRPRNVAFDSYGNIYVLDWGRSRVQKFLLSKNTCGNEILSLFSLNSDT